MRLLQANEELPKIYSGELDQTLYNKKQRCSYSHENIVYFKTYAIVSYPFA